MNKKIKCTLITLLIVLMAILPLTGCEEISSMILEQLQSELSTSTNDTTTNDTTEQNLSSQVDEQTWFDTIPKYNGNPYVEVNHNVPFFTKEEKKQRKEFETYSELDSLGRCGVAYANVCFDLMPTEDREGISNVKPSGWNNKKYDTKLVENGFLYNRSHLIAFMLCGENANEKNLITGTRSFNTAMIPFETTVRDYIYDNMSNHVLYRVTPVFEGDNLVASGVLMEAWSVEDNGYDCQFCVYVYNVQPGITIDYATGDNWLEKEAPKQNTKKKKSSYILNVKSKKFHKADCSKVQDINSANRETYKGTREELVDKGYTPCGFCKP